MEVKLNKSNNQKYVTIPKDSNLKEGDNVNVSKITPLTKEQLKKLVSEDENLQKLHKEFEKLNKSMFKDVEYKFIEKMKELLNIVTVDSDEGYETFKLDDMEIEYIFGEGFNDDFGEAHVPFCNNGISSFSTSYFEQILSDKKMMDSMVNNTKKIANIKIYTDLIESYHKTRNQKLLQFIYNYLDYSKISNNGEYEYYVYYNDLILNFNYNESYFIVYQGDTKIYL